MHDETTCSVSDCDRPARRGGLCWAHLKQRQRLGQVKGGPLREYGMAPRDRLAKAARDYADAPDDDARWRLLLKYLWRYARRYANARTNVHKPTESKPRD